MDRRMRLAMGIALGLACGTAASAQPIMGTVGDSLTDEYFEDGYGYAVNWVSHLVLSRELNFGATAALAGQPGGTWGEPRRTGYRHNWARTGATTQSLLQQGQHTGLAAQAAASNITHAVILIGANNFHFGPLGPYHSIYNSTWTPQQIESHIQSTVADVAQIISSLRAAGLGVVLVNVPDYGYAPSVRFVYTDPVKRQRVSDVIAEVNVRLRNVAAEHEIMLVNLFAAMDNLFGSHAVPNHTVLIGGREIDLTITDTMSNARPWAGFVHDGVHPHTTLQGIMANLIITALNMGHDTGVAPLSEEEILLRAGLIYGGNETLAIHMGAYADYIVNFACYANCARSTLSPILTVDDFTCFIDLFAQGDPQANCDGSTNEPILTVDDFTCFINRFAQGCY